MGAKVGASKGGMDEINVTPLIDVVLVLLIIFMVLTPITMQKMATELPPEDEDQPPPPPQQDEQLMVAIYDDASLALNLVPVDEARLAEELQKRLKGRASSKRNVFVDAHPDAAYDQVVHVIDLARDCGAERVGFADMKDEGPTRVTPEQLLIMQGGGEAAPPPPGP
ncbi:MAG: biopolymer transporter ExbD [Deltaproteobacteria bacterium]|nr:biopolymer transporter ExbD [Deltaproteobacteria bacterium]